MDGVDIADKVDGQGPKGQWDAWDRWDVGDQSGGSEREVHGHLRRSSTTVRSLRGRVPFLLSTAGCTCGYPCCCPPDSRNLKTRPRAFSRLVKSIGSLTRRGRRGVNAGLEDLILSGLAGPFACGHPGEAVNSLCVSGARESGAKARAVQTLRACGSPETSQSVWTACS